ncbi:flavoprotein [Sporosarcina sp. FSL K6-1508]|uniref:flavoprotein n=1 Tax=Sporosarcina sp. FSL K6-1508 TaxID=2921553 RepID=UPI0030F52B5A
MDITFNHFIDKYIEIWRKSSLSELRELISEDYKAREITGGKIIDFGYAESIEGWEQGFNFVNENQAKWELNKLSVIPLRDNEILIILSAALVTKDQNLDTGNIFFQTFKKECDENWKLVRSYIEAGIPLHNLRSPTVTE